MPRDRAAGAPLPRTYEPQLATLVKDPPDGDAWLHELKYDGYRIGARRDGETVELLSRRGKDWTAPFAEVVRAVRGLHLRQALLDGEVAVVLADGRTSFQSLQNYFGAFGATGTGPRGQLTYFVFDLLHLDGVDLRPLPLEERKAALAELLGRGGGGGIVRYSEHVVGNGRAFFKKACGMGLEGIVSKQRALPYTGKRTTSWLKTKCIKRQELVIGGFTDPEGSRAGIGALLVGTYDRPGGGGPLRFAGKVGTGFSHKVAVDLRRRLDALEQKTSPFDPPPTGWLRGHAHWVRPELVAEVQFAELTDDGKVRHSSFLGLRQDKAARDVVPEKPIEPSRPSIAGVSISHPDRLMYPALGLTKQDVARYYQEIGAWILPHVEGRPLTLVRCPKGMAEPESCQYMKHSKVWALEPLRRVKIPEKKKLGEYLVIDDLAGVVALAQMDILEIHTWNTRAGPDVERPDRLVFDLDPGPEVGWPEVVAGARVMRGALQALGLESFVKTTGGRGVHVVVPIAPVRPWNECLAFTRALANAIAGRDPARYTVANPKAGRERKILLDYLRNNRTNTSVAAYSTRARPEATVSVPVTWEELTARLRPEELTIVTVPRRLARLRADPWAGYWRSKQRLTDQMIAAVDALD